MFRDGVYELFYRSESAPEGGFDSLLLALRNGNILGSDKWGGVFLGRFEFDPQTQHHRLDVQLHVPPGGMLVTDAKPRPWGDTIDVTLTLANTTAMTSAFDVVNVGGGDIRVELQFKGPVPE